MTHYLFARSHAQKPTGIINDAYGGTPALHRAALIGHCYYISHPIKWGLKGDRLDSEDHTAFLCRLNYERRDLDTLQKPHALCSAYPESSTENWKYIGAMQTLS